VFDDRDVTAVIDGMIYTEESCRRHLYVSIEECEAVNDLIKAICLAHYLSCKAALDREFQGARTRADVPFILHPVLPTSFRRTGGKCPMPT